MGLRALLLVNGFLHVDTQLAGILHDSINVFTCTPPGRLDLPLYFFSRFLFSQKWVCALMDSFWREVGVYSVWARC
jgi:hypothetical protein